MCQPQGGQIRPNLKIWVFLQPGFALILVLLQHFLVHLVFLGLSLFKNPVHLVIYISIGVGGKIWPPWPTAAGRAARLRRGRPRGLLRGREAGGRAGLRAGGRPAGPGGQRGGGGRGQALPGAAQGRLRPRWASRPVQGDRWRICCCCCNFYLYFLIFSLFFMFSLFLFLAYSLVSFLFLVSF